MPCNQNQRFRRFQGSFRGMMTNDDIFGLFSPMNCLKTTTYGAFGRKK